MTNSFPNAPDKVAISGGALAESELCREPSRSTETAALAGGEPYSVGSLAGRGGLVSSVIFHPASIKTSAQRQGFYRIGISNVM